MRIMGQKPVGPTAFREFLRVVRGLLDGQEVDYTLNGETWPIRLQDRELECVNLDDRVPIYVGANGPKALAATGAYGDGRVSAGTEPSRPASCKTIWSVCAAGRRQRAGRCRKISTPRC